MSLLFAVVNGSECLNPPVCGVQPPGPDPSSYDNPSDPKNGYPDAETIHGEIVKDTKLVSAKVYRLVEAVTVKDGVTLTIEAGTKIVGDNKSKGRLIVQRGGKLMARGTKEEPIVFTSARNVGHRARGDWGGIVLNGKAPNNGAGGTIIGEGNTGEHGGEDPMDNSGVLTYVRSEFGGIEISADNEINSFTFNSVGAGTTLENLQAHYGLDDGFEWFGGTVNAKYLVSSGNDDDCFDMDRSWIGKGQFWLAVQAADKGNRGYESDNDGKGTDATSSLGSRTYPIVYNATLVGRGKASQEPQGMYIRRRAAGKYYNHLVANWVDGFVVADSVTRHSLDVDSLSIRNSLFWVYGHKDSIALGNDITGRVFKRADDNEKTNYDVYVTKSNGWKNGKVDPQFISLDYNNLIKGDDSRPDLRVGTGVDIIANAAAPKDPAARYSGEKTDFFDEGADYVGAFSSTNNWIEEWTTWATN